MSRRDREDKLNDDQAKIIANKILIGGISEFGLERSSELFRRIQVIAAKLGIIEGDPRYISMSIPLILSENDFLKVSDKIWGYILEGYLAPGHDHMNNWFPHVHVTEKGKEFIETLE